MAIAPPTFGNISQNEQFLDNFSGILELFTAGDVKRSLLNSAHESLSQKHQLKALLKLPGFDAIKISSRLRLKSLLGPAIPTN